MLNTAAIQQPTAEMDSWPSEEKGSGEDPYSQLTCCLPLEAKSTSVSVNWAGKEHLKNF